MIRKTRLPITEPTAQTRKRSSRLPDSELRRRGTAGYPRSDSALRRSPSSAVTSVGCTAPARPRGRRRTALTSSRLGRSYITSSSTSSRIARSPRAPVPRLSASSATASSASSVNTSSTSSNWKNFWYCFTSAFFGSTRMRISASWSRLCTAPMTGRRPTNSGMSPNFRRSSGSTAGEDARRGPCRRRGGCRRRSRRPGCRRGSR